MKIYVASSWRNQYFPHVVKLLEDYHHEVFDFRRDEAFNFSEVDPDWQSWTLEECRAAIRGTPRCLKAFEGDFNAMKWCEAILMVGPCGRNAHLETGWGVGAGKKTAVLLLDNQEPELMYLMLGDILINWRELSIWAETH